MDKVMIQQTTIKDCIEFDGIGIHSGKFSKVRLHPANENTGIVFVRNNIKIKAVVENVIDTLNSTSIGDGVNIFRTIEHLMASLYLANIDNVIVEFLVGEEVPIMDGSAFHIFELLSGKEEYQLAPRSYGYLSNFVRVSHKESYIMAKSTHSIEDLHITFEGYFGNVLKTQTHTYQSKLEKPNIQEEIIKARTFCHLRDIEHLKMLGLAKGGSLENSLVLTDTGILNKDGLRHQKEPVSHKILDLIGDLYLAGFRFSANIYSNMGGHNLNIKFLREALKHIKLREATEVIAV